MESDYTDVRIAAVPSVVTVARHRITAVQGTVYLVYAKQV